ncbi:hypothetical protein BCR32DRAFT_251022 [Anaeromyces robustus]|uniref:Uncharacterized protein n=1 Tax=Anaeromyces robustus TaxID=1754192 RepID=A0A1Y1VUC3_9FUNG|nr:hypothetical protein BCR32DRAFT_251022 [Anaeromyces robustus]|eukprot:ORX64605.1 hypothetical protein BCR32DRAFT_251022 [Anaeromyces robustus]
MTYQLITAIDKRDVKEIINTLSQSNCIDAKIHNNDLDIAMDMAIENNIDNKELYDFIIKKKGLFNAYFFRNSIKKNNNNVKYIENNLGLIKSIIENGFYVIGDKIDKDGEEDERNRERKHITTPLIFFIKKKLNGVVKILLENKASIEEMDENGNTPIFQTIESENYEIFDLLLHTYPVDITKKKK